MNANAQVVYSGNQQALIELVSSEYTSLIGQLKLVETLQTRAIEVPRAESLLPTTWPSKPVSIIFGNTVQLLHSIITATKQTLETLGFNLDQLPEVPTSKIIETTLQKISLEFFIDTWVQHIQETAPFYNDYCLAYSIFSCPDFKPVADKLLNQEDSTRIDLSPPFQRATRYALLTKAIANQIVDAAQKRNPNVADDIKQGEEYILVSRLLQKTEELALCINQATGVMDYILKTSSKMDKADKLEIPANELVLANSFDDLAKKKTRELLLTTTQLIQWRTEDAMFSSHIITKIPLQNLVTVLRNRKDSTQEWATIIISDRFDMTSQNPFIKNISTLCQNIPVVQYDGSLTSLVDLDVNETTVYEICVPYIEQQQRRFSTFEFRNKLDTPRNVLIIKANIFDQDTVKLPSSAPKTKSGRRSSLGAEQQQDVRNSAQFFSSKSDLSREDNIINAAFASRQHVVNKITELMCVTAGEPLVQLSAPKPGHRRRLSIFSSNNNTVQEPITPSNAAMQTVVLEQQQPQQLQHEVQSITDIEFKPTIAPRQATKRKSSDQAAATKRQSKEFKPIEQTTDTTTQSTIPQRVPILRPVTQSATNTAIATPSGNASKSFGPGRRQYPTLKKGDFSKPATTNNDTTTPTTQISTATGEVANSPECTPQ